MSNLQALCYEFAQAFENGIDELKIALRIMQQIDAEKRMRYGRSTSQGFAAALHARQQGPSPWDSVEVEVDNRLVSLLEAWVRAKMPRRGYVVPDVFGPRPLSELQKGVKKPVSQGRLALDKMARFFNRGANP